MANLSLFSLLSFFRMGKNKSEGKKSETSVSAYGEILGKKEDVSQLEEAQPYYDDLELRIERYFEESQPYLNPTLSINDVASALYTNKTYVSRVINGKMGMNYNQFINKYRIEHAVRLLRENPTMPLFELSQLCGFRSMSTFSMAFRLYMGMSPGEWARKNVKL